LAFDPLPVCAGPVVGHGCRISVTFVTRRLVEWYRAGVDVTRDVPTLATYVGHGEVGLTYWYIEAIPELLTLATERLTGRRDVGGAL
jgi:outer membrane phospholipase A